MMAGVGMKQAALNSHTPAHERSVALVFFFGIGKYQLQIRSFLSFFFFFFLLSPIL